MILTDSARLTTHMCNACMARFLMGLFTFVSSFSFTHYPKRARTCIQEHSAIMPSLAPTNRLGQHKVGALITEPGPLYAFRVSENIIWRKPAYRDIEAGSSLAFSPSITSRRQKDSAFGSCADLR